MNWVSRLAQASDVANTLLVPLGIEVNNVTVAGSGNPSVLICGGEPEWRRLLEAGTLETARTSEPSPTKERPHRVSVIAHGLFFGVDFCAVWWFNAPADQQETINGVAKDEFMATVPS